MNENERRRVPIGTALGLLTLLGGCAGVDNAGEDTSDPETGVAMSDEELAWRWRRPRPPSGSGGAANGGSPGTAGASSAGTSSVPPVDANAGCEICARANACCRDVGGGPLCSFDTATCNSMDSTRKAAYVNGCKTLLATILSVRKSLPNSCR